MTNSNIKSNLDLNDLVHLNSYFITKKISDGRFVRVILLLNYQSFVMRGYQLLLDIYKEREKIAQKFLLNEMNKR